MVIPLHKLSHQFLRILYKVPISSVNDYLFSIQIAANCQHPKLPKSLISLSPGGIRAGSIFGRSFFGGYWSSNHPRQHVDHVEDLLAPLPAAADPDDHQVKLSTEGCRKLPARNNPETANRVKMLSLKDFLLLLKIGNICVKDRFPECGLILYQMTILCLFAGCNLFALSSLDNWNSLRS